MAAAHHLQEVTRKEVEGRAKLGISAFAEALLGIPKILAENSGYDAQVGRLLQEGRHRYSYTIGHLLSQEIEWPASALAAKPSYGCVLVRYCQYWSAMAQLSA